MPKTIYATLIGINEYPTGKLTGCINDVVDIHQYLEQLARSNEEIDNYSPTFYLAPNNHDLETIQLSSMPVDSYLAPTRENILSSFQHFEKAKPGDICIFYYSGHGSFNDAPEAFWHMKSARQVETLVCVDSRTPGGRDIVDKELGYLIWESTKAKEGVHFVVIMDSCHSGDNTRSGAQNVIAKESNPNVNNKGLEEYFGYEKGGNEFYKYVEGDQKIEMPFGNYIHLAAARENQSAKEMSIDGERRGVFTYALTKSLRNGGTRFSYEALLEQIKLLVRNRIGDQLPQVTGYGSLSKENLFLGEGFAAPKKEYAVFYDAKEESWILEAGQINGIYPSTGSEQTLLELVDATGVAEVISVGIAQSKLKLSPEIADLQKDQIYHGHIIKSASAKMKINCDDSLSSGKVAEIKDAAKDSNYFEIVHSSQVAHTIRQLGNAFTLTKPNDAIPLFKRTPSPAGLVDNIERVAKWLEVYEMENPENFFNIDDLQIEVEIIEGKNISEETIDEMDRYISTTKLTNPGCIHVSYDEQDQLPAIRVKVSTTEKKYYVSALYLGSKFDISHYLKNTPEIKADGKGEYLRFQLEGNEYNTIPINFDDLYHDYGITDIMDGIKIFVSTEHFDLSKFEQEELELDVPKIKEVTRGQGFGKSKAKPIKGWQCVTIPIYVKRPIRSGIVAVPLQEGKTKVKDLKISVPGNFSANVTAASKSDVNKMMDAVGKSAGAGNLDATLLPPSTIWGNIPSGSNPLSRGSLGEKDQQLSILELDNVQGALTADHPLVINGQSLEKEETIIPFGYYPESDLYFPLGFTDEDGNIKIEKLPPPTDGKIFSDGVINEKSIGRSVKLFFKKVFGKPFVPNLDLNELRLRKLDPTTGVTNGIIPNDFLNDPEIKNVALLIHGIIGHTQPIIDSVFNLTNIHEKFDAILTFDYENLDTPIQDTALDLKKKLIDAGLFKVDEPRLTIIAHSMGGLVTRSFVEQAKGSVVLKKLIQVGTPNSGSEINDFRKTVFGLLGRSMNGAAILKPYIPILAFLGKRLSKRLFTTLEQMGPGSKFLTTLNSGEKNIENYKIIIGDTSLINLDQAKNDHFLRKWELFKERGKYKALNVLVFQDVHNDMAVKVESMRKVYDLNSMDNLADKITVVPSDHISYFHNQESLEELKRLIGEEIVI